MVQQLAGAESPVAMLLQVVREQHEIGCDPADIVAVAVDAGAKRLATAEDGGA